MRRRLGSRATEVVGGPPGLEGAERPVPSLGPGHMEAIEGGREMEYGEGLDEDRVTVP